jgi:hypothetical protein
MPYEALAASRVRQATRCALGLCGLQSGEGGVALGGAPMAVVIGVASLVGCALPPVADKRVSVPGSWCSRLARHPLEHGQAHYRAQTHYHARTLTTVAE